MDTLYSLFPDADELVKLGPEDVAPVLLRLALPQIQSAGFIPEAVTQVSVVEARAGRVYPFHKKLTVDKFLNRVWHWIERMDLIEPSPGDNGRFR